MATTGIVDGTTIVLKNAGTTIGHSTSFSYNTTASTRNITTKDTTANSSEYAGQRLDRTLSIEGFIAHDHAEGFDEFIIDMEALAGIAFTWGTFSSGDPEYSGSGIITSVTMDASLDENATYSMEIQITGDVTHGTTV